jgi:hypothetical protein
MGSVLAVLDDFLSGHAVWKSSDRKIAGGLDQNELAEVVD